MVDWDQHKCIKERSPAHLTRLLVEISNCWVESMSEK